MMSRNAERQPIDDDAEDESGDPCQRRTRSDSCGALRDDGVNRLEMAYARQRCRSSPYAAPSQDDTGTHSNCHLPNTPLRFLARSMSDSGCTFRFCRCRAFHRYLLALSAAIRCVLMWVASIMRADNSAPQSSFIQSDNHSSVNSCDACI